MARISEIVIDSLDPPALARFWAAALGGYEVRPYDEAEIARLASMGRTLESDPQVALDGPGPTIFLQETPVPKTDRNRVHLDLAGGSREEEVKRLCALGATVRDEHDSYTVLQDPEGNEFCVRDPKSTIRSAADAGPRLQESRIRPATPSDLPELVRIYNHYVTHTHVTFDTEPFTVEERRSWLEGFADSGPYRLLVAEVGSQIAGYTSSSRFRPKPAYHTSVETTVYLDPDHTGQRLGSQLYAALLDLIASEPHVHRAYGGVALPNPASLALHERFGYRPIGTFREVGDKFGRYWDVSWYERDLQDQVSPPGGA